MPVAPFPLTSASSHRIAGARLVTRVATIGFPQSASFSSNGGILAHAARACKGAIVVAHPPFGMPPAKAMPRP